MTSKGPKITLNLSAHKKKLILLASKKLSNLTPKNKLEQKVNPLKDLKRSKQSQIKPMRPYQVK